MKWVGLIILIGSIAPVLGWLRNHPEKRTWLYFLIGFLPFVTVWLHLLMAVVSWPGWIGYTKGFEIYVLDIVAVLLLLINKHNLSRPPFLLPMILYFIASVIPSISASVPEAAAFYCWQLLRVFLLYFAVTTVVANDFEAVPAILKGLAAGELVQLVSALHERFGQGVLQTWGTMGSQNELGLVSHFVIFPFFAIMLGGRRGWLPAVVVLAAMVNDALTTSRGAAILGVAGLGLVTLLSTLTFLTSRKITLAIAGLATVALVAPLALASFDERFAKSNLGLAEDTERIAYKRAAELIVADYPGGVGPNLFALVGNVGGYYERSGVRWQISGRSGNVHNIYWLVLAETGPMGLISFLLILAAPLFTAVRYGILAAKPDPDNVKRDLLIGLSVTLIIIFIHSFEEWVMIASTGEYFLAISFGMIAGLTAEERARNSARYPLAAPAGFLPRAR